MRINPVRGIAVVTALAASLSAVSCGGTGGGHPVMILVGFNLPNISGVALNQPLIFTFSDDVDPSSVTPDTIEVKGKPAFTFERLVIDGNLVAFLPSIPNFEDYSDAGLAPATTYSVFMPVVPSVDTVRSVAGKPLVVAEAFNFTTLPTPGFIETRRPLVHTGGPPAGMGDEQGCVNNPTNEFFGITPPPVFQFGTDANARLLCIKNEGPPRILPSECTPRHDQRAVGSPSASAPGTVDLGAIRVVFNEPLDPVSVVPYVPTTKLSVNVQLWYVGDTDANIATPVQIQTNKPLPVQNLDHTEVILVPVGPQLQGTYCVNIQAASTAAQPVTGSGVRDLAQISARFDDAKPASQGGYTLVNGNLVGKVPPGYRIFFRTLVLPSTNGSVTEAFSSNTNEGVGDSNAASVPTPRGTRTFTQTTSTVPPNPLGTTGNLAVAIPGVLPTPGITLTAAQPGQSTTANWNAGYTFLGLIGTPVNDYVDDGTGRLKAVFAPYLGTGADGDLTISGSTTLSDAPDIAHPNGRIFEFNNLTISAGATLTLTGDRPFVIMVRQAFVNNGSIVLSGDKGGFGIDSDGTTNYTNAAALRIGGTGGVPGPGGGVGGHGSPKVTIPNGGDAADGIGGITVFNPSNPVGNPDQGAGKHGDSANTTNFGGGGGSYGTAGAIGLPAGTNGGGVVGANDFNRALSLFVPDRAFQPNAAVQGGGGGGGGGGEDDNGASETGDGTISQAGGDDGGGGGGGGGGAVWVLADTISIGASSSIVSDGGRGGNTYGPAQQSITDPDGMAGTGDEFVSGLNVPDTTAGTGQGAGGGGGAGGGILLQARSAFTVGAGAILHATGALGGTAAGGRTGGKGGDGRVGMTLMTGGTATPAGLTGAVITAGSTYIATNWNPTIDTISQGVSKWLDLATPTADFKQPFFVTNFSQLAAPPFNLTSTDFTATLEVQGADGLNIPVGGTIQDAVTGTNVTAWTAVTLPPGTDTMSSIDNKRFVRWRWRFFVRAGYPQYAPIPSNAAPMPAILDFTLPFAK